MKRSDKISATLHFLYLEEMILQDHKASQHHLFAINQEAKAFDDVVFVYVFRN